MFKKKQRIAIIVLIPMLLFTFIVTVKTKSYSSNPANIIHEYYEYKNQKKINEISKLLYNKNELDSIKLQLSYLSEVSIVSIREYNNPSLLNLYLKSNDSLKNDDIKIYKVIYTASYSSQELYKNGEYESWCFLIKKIIQIIGY
ncbi:DUF4829 domain-containing protein [Romboutsia sp. 1001713B170207_170306_H8]|uniref:DUF4829 domain-containing protein n=2 Tax=unclassified Romboutsia TaxID=2626894 RepID=UPI0008209F91|nr:DUF4829 domain-containing protein [Romboutsia sp. 1001713B170207_170306_H8]SCH65126.1 Uncharacterised protein [uncultured Clostridium sp.]